MVHVGPLRVDRGTRRRYVPCSCLVGEPIFLLGVHRNAGIETTGSSRPPPGAQDPNSPTLDQFRFASRGSYFRMDSHRGLGPGCVVLLGSHRRRFDGNLRRDGLS